MYEIMCGSEIEGFEYTNSSLAYFEIRDNEFRTVARRIRGVASNTENTLKSAAL